MVTPGMLSHLVKQLLLPSTLGLTVRPPFALCLDRLPKLDSLQMRVEGDPRPSAMGMVLHSLRIQLGGVVHSLHLDLHQSWAGAAQAWRELGKHTALTQLVLLFDEHVSHAGGGWALYDNKQHLSLMVV